MELLHTPVIFWKKQEKEVGEQIQALMDKIKSK